MQTEKLSRKDKLIYGTGDTGLSLTSTIIGAYFLIFLTDIVGISPGIAAAAIFIGKSWDYINDPIFGHISDRTRTRWGRRRPFLLFGALPYGIAFTMMWWKPPWDNVLWLTVYYALAFMVYDAAATVVYMPYFALTPELTSNYDERTSLTTYRMFFSILGSLVAFTVPLLIIGAFNPENSARVLTMGLIFGIISALPFLMVFAGTRERPEYMEQEKPGLRQSLQAAFRNKPFIYGLLIFLLTWVSVEILQTTLLYFIKYVLKREAESDLFMAAIFVTAIVALPVWQWASERWSKRQAYIAGIAFWAVIQIVLVTLNDTTAISLIIGMCVLAGIGVSAAHVLPWSIIPDAIEWDEWKTGKRHEGMFYSLVTLIQKIASSLAVPLVGLVLELTGYAPNAVLQPPSAIQGLRFVIGPVPALLLCAGIVTAFRYPLDRKEYLRVVEELAARRTPAKETP